MEKNKAKQSVSDNPKLMAEWDWEENKGLLPEKLTVGSNKKVGWKCEKGHRWKAIIAHRAKDNGSGCPYCSGRFAITGVNDLQTLFPQIAAEWHPTKNNDITPENTLAFSGKKVWWMCEHGHEWPATVINRSKRGSGCPYCSGRNVVLCETDLATTNPQLASEWHSTLNGELTPKLVSVGSHKKVWWKCSICGNEWEASIYSRATGRGCSICAEKKKSITLNKTQLKKSGSLQDNNPSLAAEWHPSKNGDLVPSQVLPNANKKVWWICEKGHEWSATIQSRNKGSGCPKCSNELHTSFPEQVIFYYLNKVLKTKNRYIIAPRTEVDIYLPDYKIAIEYDGIRYHKGKKAEEKEVRKNKLLAEMGILLYRVKETDDIESAVDSENIIYCKYSPNFLYLNTVVSKLLSRINQVLKQEITLDINVGRDSVEIYNQYISMEKENSLSVRRPEIAAEWHPTQNGKLLPVHVSEHSNKVVSWLCSKCGHEWKTSINNRSNGTGCPKCAKHKKKQ